MQIAASDDARLRMVIVSDGTIMATRCRSSIRSCCSLQKYIYAAHRAKVDGIWSGVDATNDLSQ